MAKALSRSEIRKYVEQRVGRGMRAGAQFMVQRLKEVLGVKAPRIRSKNGVWRATVKATPGAPPRFVSGAGQKSVTFRQTPKNIIFSAIWYLLWWENHGHPWLRKTLEKYTSQLKQIIGKGV